MEASRDKRRRNRLPPSPEREVVNEGVKYVRGFSARLVEIDGQVYSFEEIRAARQGYVDYQAIAVRDAEAIANREHARKKWRELEMGRRDERPRQEESEYGGDKPLPSSFTQSKLRTTVSTCAEEATGTRRPPRLMLSKEENEQHTATTVACCQQSLSAAIRRREEETEEGPHQRKRARLEEQVGGQPGKTNQLTTSAKPPEMPPLEPVGKLTPPKRSLPSARAVPRTPTMTFHTKKALEKVLPLFGDERGSEPTTLDDTTSLTAALRGGSVERSEGIGRGVVDPPTPTVTMNTKAAMANVMSMFSGGFDDETQSLGDATLSSIPVEDRENALLKARGSRAPAKQQQQQQQQQAGSVTRKALSVALQKPRKTNREILEEELAKENRQVMANTGATHGETSRGTKLTFGDAVREVIANQASEEVGELTGNLTWDGETGFLPGTLAPVAPGLSIRVYEDPDLQAQPTPALAKKPHPPSFTVYSDFDENPKTISNDNLEPFEERSNGATRRHQNGHSGPLNVVDPWLASEEKRLLELLRDEVERYPNFFDCRREKAPGRNLLKVPRGRRVSSVGNPQLELPGVCFEVEERVGEGAFATVYKVDIIESSYIDLESGETNAALKVLNEPSLWEWYIYHQIYQRVPNHLHHNFARFYSTHVYSDKAFTLMQFNDGTLQDAMNCYHKMNKRMDEPLIIYYTLEMLKIIEMLHSVGIIHGDVKPDNFLIKSPTQSLADWDLGTSGGGGLVLIDFSRSIDMRLYPQGTVFKSGNHVEGFKCTEMTEGRPWTYQADLYGICGVVHCLLYGSFLVTVRDPKTQELRPKQPFKRYHQADLWRPLFRDFLNVKDCLSIPAVGQHRRRLEEHLKSNLAQCKLIKSLLARQNILMFERDKRAVK